MRIASTTVPLPRLRNTSKPQTQVCVGCLSLELPTKRKMRTSNLLTPAQRTICAAVGVSEKAYLRRRAFEDIGHRLTYHAVRPGDDEDGDDDAAGRDHRDNLHDDDDSPEGH